MKVILLENISNLGDLGDQVTVKSGFGRNYLIPYDKALPVTEENLKIFEDRKAELDKHNKALLKQAKELGKQVKSIKTIQLAVQISEEGDVFGSVGSKDIQEKIQEHDITIERSSIILMEGNLRTLGETQVDIKLHPSVIIPIIVCLVAEEK